MNSTPKSVHPALPVACGLAFLALLGGGILCMLAPFENERPVSESPPPHLERESAAAMPAEAPPDPPVSSKEAMGPSRFPVNITARFEDFHGKPLGHVEVKIQHRDSVLNGKGRTDGSFAATLEVNPLVRFQAALSARKAGYAPYAGKIDSPPGQRLDLGTIVLERCGTVSGRVVDGRGRPFARANVFYTMEGDHLPGISYVVWRHGGPTVPRFGDLTTRDDGFFRMNGVHAGKVRFWAEADYMLYDFTPSLVEVWAGVETTDVRLVLKPRLPIPVVRTPYEIFGLRHVLMPEGFQSARLALGEPR